MSDRSRDIDYWRRQLVHRDVDPGHPWSDAEVMAVVMTLVAAYDEAREQERDTAPALDVERLAQALDAVYAIKWPDQDPRHHPPTTVFGGYAHDIAAEYARLAGDER